MKYEMNSQKAINLEKDSKCNSQKDNGDDNE